MTGDGKNIKIWFLTAHTVIIMFLVVLIANIIGTEGEVLIERYISIKKLLIFKFYILNKLYHALSFDITIIYI